MGILIIPISHVYKGLRKILGEEEAKSLENDVTTFVNEVYNDTVGDLIKSTAVSVDEVCSDYWLPSENKKK